LRAFFAQAGDETLTWEAKGGIVHKEQVLKAASAFGNSLLGGLVLGASQAKKGGALVARPFDVPDEPTTWVSTCLMNDAVRPRPSFDA